MPASPRTYTSKSKNAQEAHEAIRPSGDSFRTPAQVSGELRGDELVLSSRLGVQPVEAAHEGALRSLLAGETLAVAQLGVAETQHLLRAGVVVLAPIPGVSMPGG